MMDSHEEMINRLFEYLKEGHPLHMSHNPFNFEEQFANDKEYYYNAILSSDLIKTIPGYGKWKYGFLLSDAGVIALQNRSFEEYYRQHSPANPVTEITAQPLPEIKERNYGQIKYVWILLIIVVIIAAIAEIIRTNK